MWVVIAAFSAKATVALAEPILKFSGRAQKTLLPQFACLCLQGLVCVALIPDYGLWGAAAGLCVSRIVLAVWQGLLVKKLLGINASLF